MWAGALGGPHVDGMHLDSKQRHFAGILEGADVLTTDRAWVQLGNVGPTVRLAR